MPIYIVKPNRDEDFYVWWSTVVDAPVAWGPRDDYESAERYDRADSSGTSANWPNCPKDRMPYGYQQNEFQIREQPDLEYGDGYWLLPRANLREFCRRRDAGEPITDLVRFERYEDG